MKQKKYTYTILILLFLAGSNLYSQKMKNYGDLEVHTDGQIGLYNSLENDGYFFSNSGLVGFYGETYFDVSGVIKPKLYDLEIANTSNIFLNIPIVVSNNANFIIGDLQTSKVESSNHLDFTPTAFSNGASDFSKVNGFVKADVSDRFMFPIGDADYLRPLSAETTDINSEFTAGYLFEDSTNTYPFSNNQEVANINTNEYWILEGSNKVSITINWNDRSSIESITEDINQLRIVGFEISTSEWKNLGGIGSTGNLASGFLTSSSFIPDEYAAITFGVLPIDEVEQPKLPLNGYHYIISPNGDGINDFFVIEELAEFENNVLHIYDRNGLLVYEAKNYINEFNGETGKSIAAIDRDSGLAQGIYYYIAAVNGGEFVLQGYLYIDR